MDTTVLAAVLGLVGSIIGTLGGILTGAKLLEYRIAQLEKRMDEIKELVDRVYRLEQKTALHDQRLKSAGFRPKEETFLDMN